MATTTTSLEGGFYWKLIYSDKNNTSDVYKATYTAERKREASKKEILEHVKEQIQKDSTTHGVSISAGGTVLGVDLSTEYNWENTKEVVDTVRTTTTSETNVTISESVKTEREYEMRPGQSLFVYQRVFRSAGVMLQQDIYQHLNKPIPEADQNGMVKLKYTVAQAVYISGIQVVYGTDGYMAPANRIKEAQGRSDDINADFGGKYVWLVPEYTSDRNKALTGIKFVHTKNNNSEYSDLAAGAGGHWRYLIPEVDPSKSKKICKLELWRSWSSAGYSRAVDIIKSDGRTGDLNEDRKGNWLFLGWDYYVEK
ncbi:hypothetical protein VKT23_012271 [Stygiomarasmius scandens]|uniref:Uncharacterized protein n=1 Tax=Marasmiellus scandens TaxID=2682957 RepID=A0ABR1J771_9AGAR